jgi:hypothetical protein
MSHDQRERVWGYVALAGFLLLAGVALAGCTVYWDGPATAQPWTPDARHVADLRAANDTCAGRRLGRPAIRWYVVPGTTFATPKGESSGWWEPDNRVYIAAADTNWDRTLRHELLHASLGHEGHGSLFRQCDL